MLKTDTYPSVFVRCSQTDGYYTKTEGSSVFTHVYPSVIEVPPQIPKWPFGFLLYMFGFRGCIGFRGCSSKKRHRYRSKNRGHVIRPSVFISLIDYTPPLNYVRFNLFTFLGIIHLLWEKNHWMLVSHKNCVYPWTFSQTIIIKLIKR